MARKKIWTEKGLNRAIALVLNRNDGLDFHRLPLAFENVKREIEKRRWYWTCAYSPIQEDYQFSITTARMCDPIIGDAFGASEFQAGCLAFIEAIEWERTHRLEEEALDRRGD